MDSYIDEVREHGFAILERVLASEEIDGLIACLEQPDSGHKRAGKRHLLSVQAVANLASDPRLLGFATRLLGNSAFPFSATLFDKTTDANWLVTWHQDTALPLKNKLDISGWGPWSLKQGVVYAHAPAAALAKVLAIRVHLDDSTEDNGPLRVLAGTHALGHLSDDAIEDLRESRPAVICTVRRGGLLAMSPLLVHASSKSRSEASRRVLHIEYAAAAALAPGLELAIA